jgi:branched-chain amino acid transport system substrate-binding protein
LVALASGCGEEGAAGGATVTVYLSAPLRGAEAEAGRRLCDEAREQAGQGRGGEDLRLRVVCLDASGPDGGWTLAQVGANARRATEDSTTVAYVGEPDPEARRQSRPIVAAAEIAELGGMSGREAVAAVRAAIAEGDESEPRQAVFDAEG